MKKIKSILLILVLCLSLCSCAELDEMRNCHAINLGNGKLKLNDQIYILLDAQHELELNYDYSDYGRDIYITEPDVPVLLSQSGIHKYLPSINKDETIINDVGDFYVREDVFDAIVSKEVEK